MSEQQVLTQFARGFSSRNINGCIVCNRYIGSRYDTCIVAPSNSSRVYRVESIVDIRLAHESIVDIRLDCRVLCTRLSSNIFDGRVSLTNKKLVSWLRCQSLFEAGCQSLSYELDLVMKRNRCLYGSVLFKITGVNLDIGNWMWQTYRIVLLICTGPGQRVCMWLREFSDLGLSFWKWNECVYANRSLDF
jgi:hypothetical protein